MLDEIHMLDASARGDQLACLVSRVGRIAKQVQLIASSATIDDPASETSNNRFIVSSVLPPPA